MNTPAECVDALVGDYERIKSEYVENGYMQIADLVWRQMLDERQFAPMKKRIQQELHMGAAFVAAVECLTAKLQSGTDTHVEAAYRQLKVYAAQTHLPMNR